MKVNYIENVFPEKNYDIFTCKWVFVLWANRLGFFRNIKQNKDSTVISFFCPFIKFVINGFFTENIIAVRLNKKKRIF